MKYDANAQGRSSKPEGKTFFDDLQFKTIILRTGANTAIHIFQFLPSCVTLANFCFEAKLSKL